MNVDAGNSFTDEAFYEKPYSKPACSGPSSTFSQFPSPKSTAIRRSSRIPDGNRKNE